MSDLLGANLVLTCQRSDCHATVAVDLGEVNLTAPPFLAGTVASALIGELVEDRQEVSYSETWDEIDGWGWDTLDDGINRALHCTAHRTEATS